MKPTADRSAEAMSRAHALAQAGDGAGAAAICRKILKSAPSHFYALFMLGSIESGARRFAQAEKLLARAVAVNPLSPDAWCSYGDALLELKRAEPAIAALTKALALNPTNLNALIYRGLAFVEAENNDAALKDFSRAVQLAPRSVHALHNRANILLQMKRFREARADVEAVLRIDPSYLPALINLVFLPMKERNYAAAVKSIDTLLARDPENVAAWIARGQALAELRRPEEARAAYQKAIALQPDASDAHLGWGNLLLEANLLEEALAVSGRAIEANPKDAANLLLRANTLFHLRRDEEALAGYAAAIAANPDYAEAHYHRGSTLLSLGRFEKGLRDFEYRWDVADCTFDRSHLNGPAWQGEDLAGKTIAVYSEQGMGDAIQFARFLPFLVEEGARVTFLCHPNLTQLFKPLLRTMEVTGSVEAARRFDYISALMSLPLHLGCARPPAAVPYLAAEEDRVAAWRRRIGGHGFKIGIAWQGNPAGAIDRGRSIPLAAFAPLAAAAGTRLISLQRIHGIDQLARLPAGMTVETLDGLDEGAQAFVDTAAVMECLDLIVVSDSAIAHTAGALAKPVWLALKDFPDWRWMLERGDSPWYPTMRLFRQARHGDWASVFTAMSGELSRKEAPP